MVHFWNFAFQYYSVKLPLHFMLYFSVSVCYMAWLKCPRIFLGNFTVLWMYSVISARDCCFFFLFI